MELKYVGRGRVTKIEMKARLIKLKNDLYNGRYHGASEEWIEAVSYTHLTLPTTLSV